MGGIEFTANLYVFLGTAIALVLLGLIVGFLARQHDQVVAQAPLVERLDVLQERLNGKQTTLDELEHELEARRQAIARLSDISAEVMVLERKRDDLLLEWGQLEPRRQEVEALRHETEAVRTEKLGVDSTLATAKAELDEVRDRLAKAEDLVRRIDALQEQETTLASRIDDLRRERQSLEEAEARVAQLAQEEQRLRDASAELQSRLAGRTGELADVEARLDSARNRAAGLQAEMDSANAALAVARQRADELTASALELTEQNAALAARKAILEREVEKVRGQASGTGDPAEDPLKDLKDPPPVVRELGQWRLRAQDSEQEALLRVKRRFDAFGLTYHDRILRAFHTAMKVNDSTQMAVLAGISGTGKSQLPRHYAAGMGIGFLQVPVQPRWDSPQDLMGFYNYIEGKFRPTDMARALYALDVINNPHPIENRMLLLLLDEMNLARVEYYFSDFLSRLESRPARGKEGDSNLRKDAEIELEIPKNPVHIFPGYNLLFAGTMNEDESTQSLSDKVVDRANVIRFGAPRTIAQSKTAPAMDTIEALARDTWDKWCGRGAETRDMTAANTRVQDMLGLMQEFGKPFGHRLGRAILAYAAAYPKVDGVGDPLATALADQVEMRLLPKLRGIDVEEKRPQFDRLVRLTTDLGDDPLANAIKSSIELSETGTGQFVWRGVIR